MIKVLFFASLKEQIGQASIKIPAQEVNTIDDIKLWLKNHNSNWGNWIYKRKLLCSRNLTMVNSASDVAAGDEIAFFPPVTGG